MTYTHVIVLIQDTATCS